VKRVKAYVKTQLVVAQLAKKSEYKKGYVHALEDVLEYIEDREWEAGEEEDE